MAAHVITALNQIQDDITLDRLDWNFMLAGLNLSCWTEDLDIEHYSELWDITEAKDIDKLSWWILSVFGIYFTEWIKFDRPTTREDWKKQKYGL